MIIIRILTCISLLAYLYINPINIVTVGAIINTIMFLGRPMGIHFDVIRMAIVETLLFFFAIMIGLTIGYIDILLYAKMLLARLLFFGIVLYDDLKYVYITEEKVIRGDNRYGS